jgi:DNA-binding winged helix-turn-helix (wHTH) protein/tetratricopeptide (TPR) repeat protein
LRLDLENEWVWQGEQCLQLPPKAFAVLRYLIEHPGRLVSKDELLHAVWPDTVVSEWALTTCMREIRKTLGEKAQAPQYIATVHRRGYRFIAPLATAPPPVSSSKFQVSSPNPTPTLVGREAELAQLHNWLEKALNGERQIVFVTGEPGIGKTTVVEAFLQQIPEARGWRLETSRPSASQVSSLKSQVPSPWIGRGQCIEHYGAGEAYLPVLDALGRLCRGPRGRQMIALLAQHAPTWLVQMPVLLAATELESLQRKTAGATRERMLRDLAEALEALTVERPLVLCLEDLHWSDSSTLEWLAFVARRRELSRVLIVGTYRPVEMLSDGHPLKRVLQELYAHQLGNELAMRRLNETEVNTYLTLRFPESVLPTRLGQVLHQRTGGNPLFLASIVQDLTRREIILQGTDGRWELHGTVAELERWTPESVRHVLARQRERLAPDDQRVLEAASLAGLEFSAAAVAAALETEAIQVEDHCGRLAEQQQFLRLAGISEWPDGTRAARYGFLHALYQEFWHERVSVGKQQQWHLRMGERKEVAYGQRAGEIAAELALHFEQGRDYRRAVQYLQRAAERAAQRSAHQEAIHHLTKGLELLKTLPDTPERAQQELTLQITLSAPLIATKGYTASEVEQAYTRARELCRQVGETPRLFSVLLGLSSFYQMRAEYRTARELAEQCLSSAQSVHSPTRVMWAHLMLGQTLFFLGELALAREHSEQGIALYDSQKHNPLVSNAVQDAGVSCLCYVARALWLLGYPDQALKRIQEALTLAQGLSHPYSLAYAFYFAAELHQFRRERQAAQEWVERSITLSTEQGFPLFLTLGTVLRGWALAKQGQMKEGIAQMRQSRSPFTLAVLAEAYGKVGQVEDGFTVVAEALALIDKTGERVNEAELYRLKGMLTLQSKTSFGQVSNKLGHVRSPQHPTPSTQAEAEACFQQAIDIAHRQSAKSLELRAVMSLSRLWQQQGKKEEAKQMLAEIYGWFTEGFDTKDLQEAKALLEELSH